MELLKEGHQQALTESVNSVLKSIHADVTNNRQIGKVNDGGESGAADVTRSLFDDPATERVLLKVALKSVPETRRPIALTLPHPFVNHKDITACLFVKDFREDEYDFNAAADEYLQVLRREGVNTVKRVIPIAQLRNEFKQYKAKRELASQYDIFLADRAVYKFLPTLLGKTFFKLHKFPREIELRPENNKTAIDNGLNITQLISAGRGVDNAVPVAVCSQSPAEIADNILAAFQQIVKHASLAGAGGASTADNIRSAHFEIKKTAVPFYFSADAVKPASNSNGSARKPKTPTGFAAEPENVDTVMSGKVQVLADGNVRVVPNLPTVNNDDEMVEGKPSKNKKKRNHKRKISEVEQHKDAPGGMTSFTSDGSVQTAPGGVSSNGLSKSARKRLKHKQKKAAAVPVADTPMQV